MDTRLRVRQQLDGREKCLSHFAAKGSSSLGRGLVEASQDLRGEFQKDRDRILHTNSFRRLKHKTQVFIAPLGDHYVTRLTHTLEVAQISRTITRALNLNEDLVEAIALGHDMGHTPFGHVGEEVLDHLYPEGFRHAAQSLRIVDILERDGRGLNLTWEVRQGIVSHSKPRGDMMQQRGLSHLTLEAQVCRLTDAVAYVNHDIRDAIRSGRLQETELPPATVRVLGKSHSQRIDTLVTDIVESSWGASGEGHSSPDQGLPAIVMSSKVRRGLTALREFMFERIYLPISAETESQKAREVIQVLYHYFSSHPDELPAVYGLRDEPTDRRVVDYISGMTDHFALMTAERIRPGISEGVRFMGL
jgi:dGTPase